MSAIIIPIFVFAVVTTLSQSFVLQHFSKHMSLANIRTSSLNGFADPEWRWGYAVGKGHDAAMLLRNELSTVESRMSFVRAITERDTSSAVDIERVKLALALRFQSARRERLPGADIAYKIMEYMAACKYEEDGVKLLKQDLDTLLSAAPAPHLPGNADESSVDPLMLTCAKALCCMEFIDRGL